MFPLSLSLSLQEAQSYADENSLLFMETSAKTAMNVNDIFLAIGTCNVLCGISAIETVVGHIYTCM